MFHQYGLLLYKEGEIKAAMKMGKLVRSFIKNFGLKWSSREKYFYCKKCKSFIFPGVNMRVRIKSNRKRIVITCKLCNESKRYLVNQSMSVINPKIKTKEKMFKTKKIIKQKHRKYRR